MRMPGLKWHLQECKKACHAVACLSRRPRARPAGLVSDIHLKRHIAARTIGSGQALVLNRHNEEL